MSAARRTRRRPLQAGAAAMVTMKAGDNQFKVTSGDVTSGKAPSSIDAAAALVGVSTSAVELASGSGREKPDAGARRQAAEIVSRHGSRVDTERLIAALREEINTP